jgi:hypothetical protein
MVFAFELEDGQPLTANVHWRARIELEVCNRTGI